MAKNYPKISDLKYKLKDDFLKSKALDYGVIWLSLMIRSCLYTGYGYLCGKRIDQAFVNALDQVDKEIISHVLAWHDKLL